MQNKLQELTDKLYNEGLSKGKKEAEDLKAAAVKESDRIIADARKEAEKIVADARKEAEELRTRVENDIRMASSQTISSVRQRIENIIISKAVSADVKKSLEDPELIRSLLTTVAGAFNAADAVPAGLEAVLPVSMQESLKAWFGKNATEAMNKGIDVTFSKQIQGGFRIGPKDGGYMISFAEGDFENILTEYLRPTARKLLFGQE
jgi:V/A-type H+-transporting ATPase subunit E